MYDINCLCDFFRCTISELGLQLSYTLRINKPVFHLLCSSAEAVMGRDLENFTIHSVLRNSEYLQFQSRLRRIPCLTLIIIYINSWRMVSFSPQGNVCCERDFLIQHWLLGRIYLTFSRNFGSTMNLRLNFG